MQFTAKQIADMVGGKVEGNPDALVNSFCKIEEGKEGAISFLSNPKYTHYIYETKSSVVLVNEDLALDHPVEATLIRVANAYETVAKLLQVYESMKPRKKGIDPLAFISPKAKIGNDCYVGPFAFIGDNVELGDNCQVFPHAYIGEGVKVGNGCTLYPGATIYHGCKIGNNVILHAGSVVGADGFGFAPGPEGYDKIPQIGIVTIEDNVEIGANTCIDRSTMGSTYVRKGVKLDNLVQIAHNTDIGANTVMSAQVGVAGSTKVGQWCMLGGQAGLAGHITVGNKVNIGAQSGVIGNLKDGLTLIGSPTQEPRAFFKEVALTRRLPEMQQQLKELQKEIKELKKKLEHDE
ncbi:MAG: UDP-3-O-(3-hydroxymyristoyl)glucosamine N-acyltransferase [Prevotella sp.]|nr:UDP-3-O-(3-hydroxymyristoyl)glucosamine N-acyltransferase [Prevotella sp.]